MLFIFAKDMRSANEFAKRNNLTPRNFRYVSGIHVLAGIGKGHTYVRLGGYLNRRDFDELEREREILKAVCGFKELEVT